MEGGCSGEAIPATNLAVGELGAPGADGNLWKALPDNSSHDVTVSVQGGRAPTNFYKFDVVPTKHKLRIDWIGTGNVTDTTTVSWAGQKMDLRASFDPALPSGVVASNYQWTVPGPAYADIDYTSQYGQAPLLTNFFTNAVLYYWAKEFDRAEVKCTAEVRGNRGEGTASFEVRKPEVTWRLTPKYPVGVYTNYQYSGTWLACGLGGEDSNSNGMVFEWQIPNVASLKGYTNTFFGIKMIQLVVTSIDENFAIAIGTNRSRFITANGLDSRYPFDSWGPIMPPRLFPLQEYDTEKDSPAERLNGTTSYTRRADDFTTILLFWPDGGRPVPLKSASWGWAGRAALVGTNYPPVYEMLPSPTHPQSAIGQPLDCPPTWSDNITHLVAPNSAGWTTNTTTFPIN